MLLAYDVQEERFEWEDGRVISDVDLPLFTEHVALIEFKRYRSYKFGSPNDKALSGHPLYSRGLRAYGAFEVNGSSWIRELERMNSVHPRHSSERFKVLHHYVFTFHDSTFECVAEGYEIAQREQSVLALMPEMQRRLSR